MSFILCIESSSTTCSVSLSQDGELLQLEEIEGGYSHSSNLTCFIESVLERQQIKPNELAAIAVSKGPGSYTGLRIGVSTAKGLCFALDIPLISISTLESMCYSKELDGVNSGRLRVLVDARRMEVYTASYDLDRKETEGITAKIVDEDSFQHEMKSEIVTFFGNGMDKCRAILAANSKARFIDGVNPSSSQMVQMAQKKFVAKDFEDVAYFEPFYLKDFVALKPKKNILD